MVYSKGILLCHMIMDIPKYSVKHPGGGCISSPGGENNALFMDNSAENELAQLKLQLNSLTQLYPDLAQPPDSETIHFPSATRTRLMRQPSPII